MGTGERVFAGPPWRVGDHELYATDVAAIILRTLADMIRARPAIPALDGVVVAHPQRFRNREKLATAQAVRMAGLSLAGLITEPDAAAWAYGLHAARAGDEGRGGSFMVFDFGGGTLDVTLMRRDAVLINTARGGLVDEAMLADALRKGALGGAGVDVLSLEPPVAGNPLLAPDIPNLIVTPHCAWGSRESRQRLVGQLAENVRGFFDGEPVRVVG